MSALNSSRNGLLFFGVLLLFGMSWIKSAVLVPEKSEVIVRTTQKIEGRKVRDGDRFRAILDEDVKVGEDTVIRAGSGAELVVKRGDKTAGDLRLKLASVFVSGRKYSLQSDFAQLKLDDSGRGTAKATAIGSGLGAIVGAIAGGGKGALIGSGVGAGTGLVISLLKKDESVVPVETRLTFQLQKPVRID